MKKLFISLLIILIAFIPTACNNSTVSSQRTPIEIRLPKDDTVNGYRTDNPDTDSNDETISSQNVGVDTSSASSKAEEQNTIQYCANIRSKVFHKANCQWVKNMNEENKFFFSDRQQLIEDGYRPCKQCAP